jgi:hypothetical protein
MVVGIGRDSPSRRATLAATARTAEESLPPEEATRQGGRQSAGMSLCSSASSGESPAGMRGRPGADGSIPIIDP